MGLGEALAVLSRSGRNPGFCGAGSPICPAPRPAGKRGGGISVREAFSRGFYTWGRWVSRVCGFSPLGRGADWGAFGRLSVREGNYRGGGPDLRGPLRSGDDPGGERGSMLLRGPTRFGSARLQGAAIAGGAGGPEEAGRGAHRKSGLHRPRRDRTQNVVWAGAFGGLRRDFARLVFPFAFGGRGFVNRPAPKKRGGGGGGEGGNVGRTTGPACDRVGERGPGGRSFKVRGGLEGRAVGFGEVTSEPT